MSLYILRICVKEQKSLVVGENDLTLLLSCTLNMSNKNKLLKKKKDLQQTK